MDKLAKALQLSFFKINFEDIPMIIHPENSNFQTKHYYNESTEFYNSQLPVNYYVINISEKLKYYIETRNNNLRLSDAIEILEFDFNYYIATTIEQMEIEAIEIETWISSNQRNGWYYFDNNYDIIDLICVKYNSILRLSIYKNELLEKRAIMMMHPKWINKILDTKNIRFEDLDYEEL